MPIPPSIEASLSGENQGVDNFSLDLQAPRDTTIAQIEFHYFDFQDSRVELSEVDPCSFAKPNEDCFSECFPWILNPDPRAPLVIKGRRSINVCREALPLTWGYAPGFSVRFVRAAIRIRGVKKPLITGRLSLRNG